jgi:hypothetical protein
MYAMPGFLLWERNPFDDLLVIVEDELLEVLGLSPKHD